jgi:hypothetical protein
MNILHPQYNTKLENFVDIPVRSLLFLLKKINLSSLFANHITDGRLKKGTYSVSSLMMVATSMVLFRSQSKNNFYQMKKLGRLHAYKNIGTLAGIEGDNFPDVKTIDDFFLNINYKDLEPILFRIFQYLLSAKVFGNHSALKKNESYYLSIDAYHIHTYHDSSQHPCEACKYCLKRERKTKEENLKKWYVHVVVIASLIFENGFQLPLCCHRIEKRKNWEGLSEDDFKQQCEMTALPIILKKIRSYLPKLKLIVLLDGLYANQTTLNILEQFHCGFSIVLKRLTSIQEDFKGLAKQTKKKVCHITSQRFYKTQSTLYVNEVPYENHKLNILEFEEQAKKKPTKRFAKVQSKEVHYQWIIHQKIEEATVFQTAEHSRLRWRGEDLANTFKNRDFNIEHDYSRHPNSQGIWLFLILIAFSLTSILLLSDLGTLSRQKATIRAFMQQMLQDLFYYSHERIFLVTYPKQLRFSVWVNAG